VEAEQRLGVAVDGEVVRNLPWHDGEVTNHRRNAFECQLSGPLLRLFDDEARVLGQPTKVRQRHVVVVGRTSEQLLGLIEASPVDLLRHEATASAS